MIDQLIHDSPPNDLSSANICYFLCKKNQNKTKQKEDKKKTKKKKKKKK